MCMQLYVPTTTVLKISNKLRSLSYPNVAFIIISYLMVVFNFTIPCSSDYIFISLATVQTTPRIYGLIANKLIN